MTVICRRGAATIQDCAINSRLCLYPPVSSSLNCHRRVIPLWVSTKGVEMGSRTGHETIVPKPAMSRVAVVSRRIRRGREKRPKHDLPAMRPLAEPMPPTASAPDLVRIAVLAMEGLGCASLRAAFTGKEVCVAVPDAATAAIFRAAIAETARTRSTDRLIRIVIDW